ncbi:MULTISPECIES: hypothetical protein [Paenibacillus]|uniref:hypothetical protein n=1 Tax=Paenibacillus TaxID=44249 RepID=UPI00096C27C0|nr:MULTISPECIES: hypothetical protein [Paenibacillus]OMF23817.1 hypothetical protein BK134_26420 [Paenibacillus peoriae]
MRKFIYLLTSAILLTTAIGCSNQDPATTSNNSEQKTNNTTIAQENKNDSDIQSVTEVATQFKLTEFEVNDYKKTITPDWVEQRKSKLEPLMTTSFLKKQADNRRIALPLELASLEKTNLTLEDLKIQEKNATKESMEITYSGNLVLKDKNEKIPLEGQLTFLKENDTWKVNNDIYNVEKLQEVLDKHK